MTGLFHSETKQCAMDIQRVSALYIMVLYKNKKTENWKYFQWFLRDFLKIAKINFHQENQSVLITKISSRKTQKVTNAQK